MDTQVLVTTEKTKVSSIWDKMSFEVRSFTEDTGDILGTQRDQCIRRHSHKVHCFKQHGGKGLSAGTQGSSLLTAGSLNASSKELRELNSSKKAKGNW